MHLHDSPYCNCLYFSMAAFYRKMAKMADEEFREAGLSPSHAFVLMTINKNPGIGPGEIAKMMFLSASTVTRLIEKLERVKLVERRSDGKFIKLIATSKGKEKDFKVEKAWEMLFRRYSTELGEEFSKKLTKEIHNAFQKI